MRCQLDAAACNVAGVVADGKLKLQCLPREGDAAVGSEAGETDAPELEEGVALKNDAIMEEIEILRCRNKLEAADLEPAFVVSREAEQLVNELQCRRPGEVAKEAELKRAVSGTDMIRLKAAAPAETPPPPNAQLLHRR